MDTLLDLIFNNLFFVILAVGAIWNFISRMTKGEEKQKDPKKKPFLDDIGEVFKEFLSDEDKEEIREQERKQPTVVRQQRHESVEEVPYVNEFEKKKLELEALKRQEQAAFKRVQTISQTTPTSSPKAQSGYVLNVKDFGKNDIAKGVIWSEVLGKPRALNPHCHSRRQV